jgi:hypothetical protein
MIGAIRTDESAGGFEGQSDFPAQYQVPVQIPEPYLVTLSGHDCPMQDKSPSNSRPASLLMFFRFTRYSGQGAACRTLTSFYLEKDETAFIPSEKAAFSRQRLITTNRLQCKVTLYKR